MVACLQTNYLAEDIKDALAGRESTCGGWSIPFEELYCLALAALVNPKKRGEALAAVENVIRRVVEPIPVEIMEGYGIIDNKPTDIGLYFLYKILVKHR